MAMTIAPENEGGVMRLRFLRTGVFLMFGFSRWHCVRKALGGKWEKHNVRDPVCDTMWLPVDEFSTPDNRPALCGKPLFIEDHQ